ANVGSRAQRLEAVQEARRNVQMPKIFVVEQECLLLGESGRVPSNINEHVVYGAVGAADKLRLAAPRASVHASDYPLRRTGLGVLHERSRGSRRAEVVIKDVRVEGPREQAAVVAERLRDEDEHVRERGLFDAHVEMLP